MSAVEPIFDDEADQPQPEGSFFQSAGKWLILLLSLLVADVSIYRSEGYAGFSLFLVLAPALWAFLYFRPQSRTRTLLVYLMLVILAARMLISGFWLQPIMGGWLLVVYAMLLTGRTPHVLESIQYATQSAVAGFTLLQKRSYRERRGVWNTIGLSGTLSVVIPVFFVLMFGFLFFLANPHLMELFGETFELWFQTIREWYVEHGPQPLELAFLILVLFVTAGLVRPVNRSLDMLDITDENEVIDDFVQRDQPSVLYASYRNTLIAVVILFAVYMVFEFQTLWFRDYPDGFHYSGYAHEGAFWLTVALGLSTLTLSSIFRRATFSDARIQGLKKIAWLWSAENLFLALAVYHRLCIYVGFNGMTQMRVVGFFGISAVVGGFALVVIKIIKQRRFHWLIRRQLWVLAIFVYLYAVVPTDRFVAQYNVRHILAGNPAPAVQFAVHPLSDEAALKLFPLLECEDEIIREGVRAILSARFDREKEEAKERKKSGWTAYSLAHRKLLALMTDKSAQLVFERGQGERDTAKEAFIDHTYQWY
ncbi:MAG: DUF4173 domain-containing protein [Planctomycetaceae bacterium]|jgi:hypothetical protein|nr:DUF4173 domain-containing protein [Planctomycetaceae bacterium]